jgi:hypothetical protein
MKICGQDFGGETIARIRELIGTGLGRTRLSQEVCRILDWKNAAGKLKEMSCRIALRSLHDKGEIVLPEARVIDFERKGSSGISEVGPEPEPGPVSGTLSDLGTVELQRVGAGDKTLSRLWFDLMARHHYLGKGTLCGAQIRYMIRSERQGVLGAASFSSAAWKVAIRDSWIGWSPERRVEALSRVVANSRFLILPHVTVPNLASHVLGKLVRRLPRDWEETYGERPLLLETFVEEGRFSGTCYRAAGWQEIGRTAGLGRQGRGVPVKKVLVYPLVEEARSLLRGGDSVFEKPRPVLPPPADWAEEEFRGVLLPDKRLLARLLSLARDFFARPTAQLPQACGSRAGTKAAYRFFDQEEATMDVLLSAHIKATEERMKAHPVVLCVQDTTDLNYTAHPDTKGLGPIGDHLHGPLGLMMHDTLAFDVIGTPLGLLDVQCWARPPAPQTPSNGPETPEEKETARKEKEKKDREDKKAPIEEKESYKWLKSFEAVAEIQKRCPGTMLVSMGDRESDVYELFALAQKDPKGPKLLIRAVQPRKMTDGTALWKTLLDRSPDGEIVLQVPRRQSRASREAILEIRFSKVELAPPFPRKRGLSPVTLWAVAATEKNVQAGAPPLSWLLLTTVPVETLAQALEKVDWYTKRWGIEVFHRTLKSGCRIEDRQLGNDHRLEACLAIDLVVAWRLFHLAKLGRETPDVPCTVFFEEHEWRALVTFHDRVPVAPDAPPPTLRDATRMVAQLGGFLGRKGDGEPGTETLWKGIQRLDDLAAMWTIFSNLQNCPASPVPTRRKYG